MVWRRHRWLGLSLLAIGLLAGCLGLAARSLGALTWFEQHSIDARFALRGHRPPSGGVVVVALDVGSIRHLPRPPLPRGLDAQLIDRLSRVGARVIAFDFALEGPTSDARGDRLLVRSLSQTKRAVVSVTAVSPGGVTDPLAGRVPFADVDVRPGVTLLPLDSDGAIRRFPSPLGGVESFAVASARRADQGVGGPPAGALIDYPGPAGTVPALALADVLLGRLDPRSVRGKVVVVGPTAPVLQDLHRTPLAPAMAGPEIQADAIATALDGFPLRVASAPSTTLLLLGLGLTAPLAWLASLVVRRRRIDAGSEQVVAPALGTLATPVIGAAALVAWSVLAQVAFDHGTVLDYADGLLTIAGATAGAWTLATLLDRRERWRLRMLFAAGAPQVVTGVLNDAQMSVLTPIMVIAGYRIEEKVGEGGMGVVYRASQLHLDRPVALKLIRPEYADTPSYRARFERESRLAAAVAHPNVIPVFDAGEDAGLLYIAMQYIEGIDLAHFLDAFGALDVAHSALLVRQIGGALDAAHQHHLVHRDVKPANIVLRVDDPDHAFLTDFGLAKEVGGPSQFTQAWAGTVDYMAPEQIDGLPVDHRADVYALAGVLYHCLTGSVPFPREDVRATMWGHLNAPRPSATALRPELPATIDRVIARGMARAPGERHASAGALAADAGAALGHPVRMSQMPGHKEGCQGTLRIVEHGPTHVSE